jgi:subtilisin family serine protease
VKVRGSVASALDKLQNRSAVAFVEPNYVLKHRDVADDTYYSNGNMWGTYGDDVPMCGPSGTTNQFGSDAEEAWSFGYTGSREVYVGIIDEGIQVNHPDLASNIWVNPHDAVDGIDNDGNGYIDDINGWDFYNRNNSVFDPADGDAHGTHVAGTIGAQGSNTDGVVGVNWNVSMISAKFLGPQGGYLSDAIDAVNYLRDLKTRHNLNIVAINNSWGGGGYSSALHTAINRAAKQGILFVAAAGNDGLNTDTNASYPSNYSTLQSTALESAANYEAVVSVAALTSGGGLAYFSNYGARTVDIGAPGAGIVSTVPTDSYASYSGTSMAAPHVTGALALYASAFPAATAEQIRTAVLKNARATSSLSTRTVTGGRLNLSNLFTNAGPAPTSTPTPEPTPSQTPTETPTPGAPGEIPTSTPTPTVTPTFTPAPPTTTRDVAVMSVSAPSSVTPGTVTTVTARIANEGTQGETFTVILDPSHGSAETAQSVSLPAGGVTSVSFSWTAPRKKQERVQLRVSIPALPEETDTRDNKDSATIQVRSSGTRGND